MFKKNSNLLKYAIGFALGVVGVPVLKSGLAKKAYTYLAAGAFIAKDSIMEEVEKTQACASDIAEDARVLQEEYYAKRDMACEEAKECEEEVEEEA